MDKKELGQITEGIQAAYDQLSETINEIGHLKELTSKLTSATEEMKTLFNDVLSNKKLIDFQNQSNITTNALKANIQKIDSDLNMILTNRVQYLESIDTFKEIISKYQAGTEKEVKTIQDSMKDLIQATAKVKIDQQRTKIELEKTNRALETAKVVTKYDELNKKIDNLSEKIRRIESILTNKGK